MKPARYFFIFVLAGVAAVAAPLTRDLGSNLFYHRIHILPGDLPGPEPSRPLTRIIDLRYVQGDKDAAVALVAWVKFHAAPRTPIIVLANADTHPALLAPFANRGGGPAVLVVGLPGAAFVPDIAIDTSAEKDRLAYDALEHGAELLTLIAENPDKPRYDEASLSRDRSTEAESAADARKAAVNSPPTDATLQRAIHLHRALRALKKV
ncbi:MAG: hypothetical protein RIQ93_1400 [Verrucomicrobiota bacterium]|jgi:hypothetical protein